MLIHRAVRRGKVALIAAGGHHKGVRQAQGTGVILCIPGILNGYVPRLALGGDAMDIHVAAKTDKAAGDAAFGKQLRRLIGGIAFADAAQIDGTPLVQRGGGAAEPDMLAAHQRQQRIDLLLRGDAGTR